MTTKIKITGDYRDLDQGIIILSGSGVKRESSPVSSNCFIVVDILVELVNKFGQDEMMNCGRLSIPFQSFNNFKKKFLEYSGKCLSVEGFKDLSNKQQVLVYVFDLIEDHSKNDFYLQYLNIFREHFSLSLFGENLSSKEALDVYYFTSEKAKEIRDAVYGY